MVATAEAGHYFLAFEKDNPGLFDEKNNKYYRLVPKLSTVFQTYLTLVADS